MGGNLKKKSKLFVASGLVCYVCNFKKLRAVGDHEFLLLGGGAVEECFHVSSQYYFQLYTFNF